MSDQELLRQYVDEGANDAFATLVERHLDLVYSVARRQVQSAALAGDVAQAVFIELAQNARHIKPDTPLIAWLHLASRRRAINAVRDEARRRAREQHAAEIAAMKSNPPDWAAVEPLLDEAVESLDATDRTAILLRYFENKSLRDVGTALGISDDTAQKRVSRAVERLRDFFLRRGVAVSAAGLATNLSAHALQSAPAALGVSILSATNTIIPAAAISTSTVVTMTTLQKTFLAGVALAAFGSAIYEAGALRAERARAETVNQRIDDLMAQARQARQARDMATRQGEDLARQLAAQAPEAVPSPAEAAAAAEMQAWLERIARLKQIQQERPDLTIPEIQFVDEDAWFYAARNPVDVESGVRSAFAILRQKGESAFVNKLQRALRAYLDAHDGQLPTSAEALAPFIDPRPGPELFVRYEIKAAGNVAALRSRDVDVIVQQSPVDLERDSIWHIHPNRISHGPALATFVARAQRAYAAANQGARATEPAQLAPYLPAPVSPERLKSYLDRRQ